MIAFLVESSLETQPAQGTFHFRTILPSEAVMEQTMSQFKKFHEEFISKFSK